MRAPVCSFIERLKAILIPGSRGRSCLIEIDEADKVEVKPVTITLVPLELPGELFLLPSCFHPKFMSTVAGKSPFKLFE